MKNVEFVSFERFETTFVRNDFNRFCDFIRDLMVDTTDLEGIKMEEICLLYFEELKEARIVKKQLLTVKEILDVLKRQTSVYRVTTVTFLQDKELLLKILICDLHLGEVVNSSVMRVLQKNASHKFTVQNNECSTRNSIYVV